MGQLESQLDLLAVFGKHYDQTTLPEVHLVQLSSSFVSKIALDSLDFFILRSWLEQVFTLHFSFLLMMKTLLFIPTFM